ncbi:MAG: TIGR02186 family protein [Bryobacteraceae bacterium]|nr:TIGR02186 family protein [Bryobacteraceae bacterium]
MTRRTLILLTVTAGLAAAPVIPERRRPTLKVAPETIHMDAFYSGARVQIEGEVAEGSKVVVLVVGGEKEETFNRKTRAGPIWINSGKVHVSGVPSIFLRFSDGAVRYFLSRNAMEEHQLDEAAIKHQMHIEPHQDTDIVLASWLTLKAQEGLYQLVRDGVKMGTPAGGATPYSVDFRLPKRAHAGVYQVRAYECRDRAVVGVASQDLKVEAAGFPAWLAGLSHEHALAYGIIAVVISAIAGFGIDLVTAWLFGGRRVAAH